MAIKQLSSEPSADPGVQCRFTAEARVLASLDHPQVVPVYDFVDRDDVCLLVMELLPGGTLRSQAAGISARAVRPPRSGTPQGRRSSVIESLVSSGREATEEGQTQCEANACWVRRVGYCSSSTTMSDSASAERSFRIVNASSGTSTPAGEAPEAEPEPGPPTSGRANSTVPAAADR
jgi:hypothetical protein